jgi:hypothetical protein
MPVSVRHAVIAQFNLDGKASMKFYRLYTGANGQSHFEALESGRASEFFNTTCEATGVLFRNRSAPHIVNYHRAPQRRWVITLAGSVEIGLDDGTKITFHPGDVFLAEDTNGQGHTATPHDWARAYVNLE